MTPADGERRAWGWVAALRDGSTTPWAGWDAAADRTGRALPGAQQLEVLRRLNAAAAASGRRPDPALVERVLAVSAPGRGRPDLELVGAVPPSRFGFPPVDPADLPADELLRVATNLIAEDAVAAGLPPARSQRRPRPWRTAYRLVGPPWFADPMREELVRRGHPPGGRRPVVHVVAPDLAAAVVGAYVSRSLDDGGGPWSAFVDELPRHRRLPVRADVGRAAQRWAEQVGPQRVRVVTDLTRLPRLVGVRRRLPVAALPSADAVDLLRRTALPLGLLVLPDRRQQLLHRALLPRLADDDAAPLVLPADALAWVAERAARLRRTMEGAQYAVVGDAGLLDPAPEMAGSAGSGPDVDRVLVLALRLLLEGAAGPGGRVEEER